MSVLQVPESTCVVMLMGPLLFSLSLFLSLPSCPCTSACMSSGSSFTHKCVFLSCSHLFVFTNFILQPFVTFLTLYISSSHVPVLLSASAMVHHGIYRLLWSGWIWSGQGLSAAHDHLHWRFREPPAAERDNPSTGGESCCSTNTLAVLPSGDGMRKQNSYRMGLTLVTCFLSFSYCPLAHH